MLMMVADSLRAILLEKSGYKVDIFDFVSSRYTDKNTMVRSRKKGARQDINLDEEYKSVSSEFRIRPYLEELLTSAV
jgi:pyruvate/2-oxoglutarate/acetoin dehydrogenase E1 component